MSEETNKPAEFLFDLTAFQQLSDAQKLAVFGLVAQRKGRHQELTLASVDADDLRSALNIYRTDAGGCVPDDEMGDDIVKTIHTKFYDFFAVVRTQAEQQLRARRFRPSLNIIIQPDYEDSTVSMIYDRDRPLFYLWHAQKAWTFNFSSAAEVADEILRLTEQVVRSYARFSKYRRRLPTLFAASVVG